MNRERRGNSPKLIVNKNLMIISFADQFSDETLKLVQEARIQALAANSACTRLHQAAREVLIT